MGTTLITGGAGYIGSHAAKALRRAGRAVVIFDNLSAGHREAALGAPLELGDTADEARLREVIRRHGVTAVMHFAARLDVGESVRDPGLYYRNNVSGTLSLLGAMAAERVLHLVFSSTCAVYGEPERTPIDEGHATRPINAYGETKLAIERALPHFEKAYGLRAICLRYFNAAGADPEGELGEDHDPEIHLIPRAIEAARGGRPLAVFGTDYPTPDGTCQRDYIHVSDLADAHLAALNVLEGGEAAAAYNLGNGRPFSVLEVISSVERVSGRRVPRAVSQRRPGDPAVLFASNTRARLELSWAPRLGDLDTMVDTAWRWHEAHPGGYRGR
jgi:UDP-glucose-4-epimerase GalE